MLKDVDIHSISPDLGYPSAQTFNQRHPENLGKPPHAKTMNPEQQSLEHYRPNMLELWVAQKNMSYTVPCHNDKENPVCKQIVTVR